MTFEQAEARARKLLAVQYAAVLRSPASAFIAVFYAAGPKVDYTRVIRERAIQMFKENPEKAVALKLVDPMSTPENVIVLDSREWLIEPAEGVRGRRNPNYGKPLQPFYQQKLCGIGFKYGTKQMKFLSLTIRHDVEPILNEVVTARFVIRGEDETTYYLTSSRTTKFEKTESELFRDWSQARLVSLLDKAPVKVSVLELEEWHSKYAKNPARMAILEADLVGIREEAATSGNYVVFLGDVEADISLTPIACFMPETEYAKIKDLGLGSRLLITGYTTLGTDLTTGEQTRIIFNALHVAVKEAISKEESLLETPTENIEWSE